jgi:hypothetical protein
MMKKLLSTILALICFGSIMLASAERSDGSPSILWSLGCIAVACVCGLLFVSLNPNFRKGGLGI